MSTSTLVIAEAGVNHNGSIDMALQLIDVAKSAGADAVKFQTFKSEAVISRHAVKAEYQVSTTGSDETQLEMVKKLELDLAAHQRLVAHCTKVGIRFLSTPFDEPSVDVLAKELNVPLLKSPSGEITNALLLLKMARTGKPIILSTGMSNLGDIEEALGVLAFGYVHGDTAPSRDAFAAAYRSDAGYAALAKNVSLLHCTTEYPAPLADVNLAAMDTMARAFGLPVGYSDHTKGIAVSVAAGARGATIIEKHFTLDRKLPGPDHQASLEPNELADMVRSIREVELAIGKGRKMVAPAEQKNVAIARKSLVAARAVAKGEIWSAENLTAKRPGTGVSPMEFWSYVGKPAARAYTPDEPLDPHAH